MALDALHDPDTVVGPSKARDLEARLSQEGKTLVDLPVPTGTQDEVALGASLADYVLERTDDLEWAKKHLVIALRYISAGQWEATRWWPKRKAGIRSIGLCMLRLAQQKQGREWLEKFLLEYFDVARRNGRHACWVYLVCAVPTLELLRPSVIVDVWNRVQPIEEWHQHNPYHLARWHEDHGSLTVAQHLYQRCLRECREGGDDGCISNCLYGLGRVARFQGRCLEARDYIQQSLKIDETAKDKVGTAYGFWELGLIAEAEADYEEARRLLEEALAIMEHLGIPAVAKAREDLARLMSTTSHTGMRE